MLDVHAPHQTVHTWKDFLVHIAAIRIGLLIAVGLEQTVEFFHHQHQVAEARKAIDLEVQLNINRGAKVRRPAFRNELLVITNAAN
jgi:hypothetical protein